MSGVTSSASSALTRTAALAVFGLLTLLTASGLVLAALAREPLWPNGAAAMVVFAFPVAGVLIAWHRPSNAIAWLCLAIGFLWGLEGTLWGIALYGFAHQWNSPPPDLFAGLGDAVVMPGIFLTATLLLLLFPNGRLPSPRWRWVGWLSGISIAGLLLVGILDPESTGWSRPQYESPLAPEDLGVFEAPVLLILVSAFFCVVASVVALVRRYRASRGIERLQLKWLVASGAGAVLVWFVAIFIVERLAGEDAAVAVTVGAFTLIPAAIGVSILRYRLYDIDLIINRTLVYATLTVSTVASYVSLVVALGWLARTLSGQGSNAFAVAATTLVVAALFQPARRRIQSAVDRRFYRARYDAARTLEAFQSRLRDQTDLESLSDEVVAVVRDTVQPAHATVWLRAGGAEVSVLTIPIATGDPVTISDRPGSTVTIERSESCRHS